MKNIFLLIIVFCVFVIWATFSNAQIVINELMVNPDQSGEWIEVYNGDSLECNMTKFCITDGDDYFFLSTLHDIIVPAKSFLIIAQDSAKLMSAFSWTACSVLDPPGWLTLNNTGDIVVLKDSNGVVVDSVCYKPSEWFGCSVPKGVSLERRDINGRTNAASNWALSQNFQKATPGFRNSVKIAVAQSLQVKAGPKIFRPGEAELFAVHTDIPAGANLRVEIYNLEGLKVKTLFAGKNFGPENFTWNGNDVYGKTVRRGVYVLFVKLEYGNSNEIYKQSVVVAPPR